jgi:hypothetical protein
MKQSDFVLLACREDARFFSHISFQPRSHVLNLLYHLFSPENSPETLCLLRPNGTWGTLRPTHQPGNPAATIKLIDAYLYWPPALSKAMAQSAPCLCDKSGTTVDWLNDVKGWAHTHENRGSD